MLYKVTSVAFDPDARKAYYTEDNYAFRDLIEVDVDTGKKRMLLRDARIGDMVAQPGATSRCGASATRTALRPSSAFRRPTPASTRSTPSTTARSRSTSTSRPTARMVSACFGEINGTQSVRVWTIDSAVERWRPAEEVARLDLPPSTPEGFTFTPDGKSLVRHQSYYTGVSNVFRFDIATPEI